MTSPMERRLAREAEGPALSKHQALRMGLPWGAALLPKIRRDEVLRRAENRLGPRVSRAERQNSPLARL